MASADSHLHVVILAGGIGSRFWPASVRTRPKQLLPLASSRPLIRDTVQRGLDLVPPERLRILAGAHLVAPFRRALTDGEIGVPPPRIEELFWEEPRARGTGPVLAWAARRIAREDPDAVMVSLHADHFIDPPAAFRETVERAARLARRFDLLFTIAVQPTRPETGYGYLRLGEALPGADGGWNLGAFVEKPDRRTAERHVEEGRRWNSGIFVWPVSRFLEEVRAHAPEIGSALPRLDEGDEAGFFRDVTSISVDEAVLERSERVGAVEATFRWDDMGNWNSLARTREPDAAGNVATGDARIVEGTGNVVWAEDGPVVLYGVEDLVVARAGGVTLVTSRAGADDLKSLVDRLPEDLRDPRTAPGEPTQGGGG